MANDSYGLSDLPTEPPDDWERFERLARQRRRAVLRGRDAPNTTTNAANVASAGAALLPGSGILDAFGYMPDFNGGYEPSLLENLRRGNYATAGGQALGVIGDGLYVVPLAGATVGTALKSGRSASRAARAASAREPKIGGRPREEVFATYEQMRGSRTNHLPGLDAADEATRLAYSNDPRRSWENAPGDRRDAIYAGMRQPDTGRPLQVRSTTEAQGFYINPFEQIETNPGWTARPTLSRESVDPRSISERDRALLTAAETTRGYVDAQDASAFHKAWRDPQGTSLFVPLEGKLSKEQIGELRTIALSRGLDGVIDVGSGVTLTTYGKVPQRLDSAKWDDLVGEIRRVLPGAVPERVRVESGYIDFPEWHNGAATKILLEKVNATPEIRNALNENGAIPHKALSNLRLDDAYTEQYGVTNDAIQNARRIIGAGRGWIDRLEAGLKEGTILPAVAAAILAPALAFPERKESSAQRDRV